ncbi:MAG: LPXTG cell wall anchor domain-containing protein, partial [Ruminococcus sp.]
PTGDAAWTEIKVTPTITQKTSAGANDAQYELTGLTNAGDNTFAFVTKTVKNVKITVPKTGGMGTTLFTICGASLIVLAGVMFVVLKRKKTSK